MEPASNVAANIAARLDRLPATRTVWKLILLLSFGAFFELYDLLFSAYIAPGLIESGILTPTTEVLFGSQGVASFIAALFFGLFIGTLMCGFLADRYGRRTIFTYSLLWYATANTIMAFQTTAFALNFWRFIAGIGLGLESITIGAYLSELTPKAVRGRAFALAQTIGFLATPVVAFLSYLLVPHTFLHLEGWRWVVLIGTHSAIFIWWIRRHLPESPRWLATKNRLQEAETILHTLEKKIAAEYGHPLPEPNALNAKTIRVVPFKAIWRYPLRNHTIMLLLFHLFHTIGYYGFANWAPTLLIQQGIVITKSLLFTTIIALAAPIGPLIGFYIADRFERKNVIVSMAILNIICGLLFSMATHPASIIILGIGLTLAGNLCSSTYHTYQQELYPTPIRARAVGFVYAWSRLSTVFSAFMIAFVLRDFGVMSVFIFIAMAMSIVALTIGIMGPPTKQKALEEIA